MQRHSIQLLVILVFTMLAVGTVVAADQVQPATGPAVETPQEAPQLPSETPAVPSPPAPEPPAPDTQAPDTPVPAETPPEAPADPCKGCACGGGMVTPACLECCR